MPRLIALIIFGLLVPVCAAPSPETKPAAGQAHVLIVVGAPGTPLFARHYADWQKRFETYFAQRAPAKSRPLTISGDRATSPAVRQALAQLAPVVQPADQFVLILLGHGAADGSFVLPGPDLSSKDLAESLAAIKARNQVILNFSSSSGASLPVLRQTGRVVVTAGSMGQASDSDFAEFFLLALEAAPPGAPVTLLDAFNKAAHENALWIVRQRQTEEGWTVQGRQSLAIFKRLYDGPDVPPSRRLAPSGSDDSKDDAIVPLVPDGKPDFWTGRRLVTEHALLEDTGLSEGASAVAFDGHHPLAPKKDGDPGDIARRVILGKAELAGGSK